MKKKLMLMISILIFLQSISYSYAYSQVENTSNYSTFRNEEYENYKTVENTKITILENDKTRTVRMLSLDKGTIDELIFYKNENKIYSTITGKYTSLDTNLHNNNLFTYRFARKGVNKTYYFSYHKLTNILGKSATAAGVASLVASTIGIAFPPANIVAAIFGGYSTGVSSALWDASTSKKHGIYVTVNPNPIFHIIGVGKY